MRFELARLTIGMGLLSGSAAAQDTAQQDVLFVEAESFADLGGWVLDQQFMDLMGSPYLLAHGMGRPVADASTSIEVPEPGPHRVWVRTRDWVAPWKASGAPGSFELVVDGRPLHTIFGTKNDRWHWHDGGIVELGDRAEIRLRDLTGFEGRCDAVVFAPDVDFVPPEASDELATFRRASLGFSDPPASAGSFDLVVVGGGMAGTSAAVTAARLGLTVALVQDRPVLRRPVRGTARAPSRDARPSVPPPSRRPSAGSEWPHRDRPIRSGLGRGPRRSVGISPSPPRLRRSRRPTRTRCPGRRPKDRSSRTRRDC